MLYAAIGIQRFVMLVKQASGSCYREPLPCKIDRVGSPVLAQSLIYKYLLYFPQEMGATAEQRHDTAREQRKEAFGLPQPNNETLSECRTPKERTPQRSANVDL
jgi:hypothetical protein